MGDTENRAPAGYDAGLKRILLCCEGYDFVPLMGLPRNNYAPVKVFHDIDTVCVVVEANDPCAEVALNGIPLAAGQESKPVLLSCGKNAFSVTVAAADGRTKNEFRFKVFRDYPQPAWKQMKDTVPWVPRDSAGELVFRDRMWIIGGYTPRMANDVWSSGDGLVWTKEGDVPTRKGIDIPIAFVFGERMWVTDIEGVLFSSADGKSWSIATEEAPWRGRNSAGCVVFEGRIWVMGGRKAGELLNDIWSSPDGVHWTLESQHAPWSKRQIHHTPVVLDGRIWLLGGGVIGATYHPFVAWNDVWNSADGTHWEQVLDHAPWIPRIWGSSAVYRDRMWIMGGFRSEPTWENLGDVWYSSDGVVWRQLETVPSIRHSGANNVSFTLSDSVWAPRHEQSAYAFAGGLWIVGGMVWPLKNDVWRLTIPNLCFVTQPVIEIYAQGLYEYQAHADFNHSRQRVLYRLERGPTWLSVDKETGLLRGTAPQPGDFEVRLEAYDAGGETAQQKYTLHVLPIE